MKSAFWVLLRRGGGAFGRYPAEGAREAAQTNDGEKRQSRNSAGKKKNPQRKTDLAFLFLCSKILRTS